MRWHAIIRDIGIRLFVRVGWSVLSLDLIWSAPSSRGPADYTASLGPLASKGMTSRWVVLAGGWQGEGAASGAQCRSDLYPPHSLAAGEAARSGSRSRCLPDHIEEYAPMSLAARLLRAESNLMALEGQYEAAIQIQRKVCSSPVTWLPIGSCSPI